MKTREEVRLHIIELREQYINMLSNKLEYNLKECHDLQAQINALKWVINL